MIVVDTQMPLPLTVDTDDSEQARLVYALDPVWSVPLLRRSEYRNAIMRYIRIGHLSLDEAIACDRRASIILSGHEYVSDSADVIRTALEFKLTAYDAEFVSLARRLGARLVTLDKQILTNCSKIAVRPNNFVRAS